MSQRSQSGATRLGRRRWRRWQSSTRGIGSQVRMEFAAWETGEIERLIVLSIYPRIGSDGHHRAAGERSGGQHGFGCRIRPANRWGAHGAVAEPIAALPRRRVRDRLRVVVKSRGVCVCLRGRHSKKESKSVSLFKMFQLYLLCLTGILYPALAIQNSMLPGF